MIQAYRVSMFLFVLNTAIMMFMQMPLFGAAYMDSNISTMSSNFTYQYDVENSTYVMAYDSDLINITNTFDGYQPTGLAEPGILDCLTMFFTAIYRSTVYLPWFLDSLGLPLPITLIITGPVWFVYGAGIVQLVRGVVFE